MSGIVGLVQFDGSPVESELLRRLTDFLAFRGPDNQQIWIKGNVGFGRTLFKTTEESERDCQPLTLDGKTWIVADARIDDREELFAAFKAAGEPDVAQSSWTDAELILRAYRLWGADCVVRLLGDFAFGIWDDARKQFFCARDHMGVKPFFYARVGSCLLFSNTLDCIRQHPLVSDKLNDLTVGDFLLFGFNQDSASTFFSDIHRLPAAHCGIWSADSFTLRRYWAMPIEEPIFYDRPGDYIDQFDDLLRKSVADRLRTNQVWVFMSGGIDSPTLAASGRELLERQYASFDLRALTKTDSFVPDERHYAEATAHYLGIPILFRRWTKDADPEWERIPFRTPEPYPHSWTIPGENEFWHGLESYSRVFFYGEGPDNALHCDWAPYLSRLVSRGNYRALLRSIFATVISERRPPFWGRIANRISRSASAHTSGPDYPDWLDRNFESRLCLRERWNTYGWRPALIHPWRPRSYASLQTPLWQATFESFDMGATQTFYEMRYPFVDIRMLRFLLSVPALPWCRSKRLLRVAMRRRLPGEVLRRRKTATNHLTVFKYLEDFCRSPLEPAIDLGNYVNAHRVPTATCAASTESNLRVRSLNHWLQHSRPRPHNLLQESVCDPFVRQPR
jgi:asparagine synthase (glutamine-hydrolysing)